MSKKNLVAAICCTAFIFLAFCNVTAFVDNARRGMLLFGNNVLPVLFPFFFISSLLIELDLFKKHGARLGVVVMSYLSGYPTGARMLSELYARGTLTRTQAIKTATYTSTASPIFIIATMGVALYGDVRLGVIIFVAHILGALCNGLLYCRMKFNDNIATNLVQINSPNKNDSLGESVSRALYGAIQNILAVGGFIIIFFVASAPFGAPIAAILEMTTGVFRAAEFTSNIIVPCAIVSFGGLCVAMQGFVFLKNFQMPVWFYFLYKITHMLLSVGVCALLALVI